MPLFSALSTGALAVVSLLAGRRELAWKLFAAFALFLTVPPLCMLLGRFVFPEQIVYSARLAPAFALASFGSAMLYVAVIGRLKFEHVHFGRQFAFDFESDPPRLVLAGRERTFGWYLAVATCVWLLCLFPLVFTDLFLERVELTQEGPHLDFGPGVYVLATLLIASAIKLEVFLWRAYKNAQSPHLRSFLIFNLVAFGVLYLPALCLHTLLPAFRITSEPVGMLFVPVAVFVFFAGIVRYQFAHIQDLNRSLEAKVLERTRELERAQLRLIQSEKVASVAQIVASLTHELNSPIGAIQSMADCARIATGRLKNGDPRQQHGDARNLAVLDDAHRVIGDGAKRVSELVNRLRSFARLDEAQFQEISLESSLDQAVSIVAAELPPETELVREYTATGALRCQPVLLNQLWFNLLSNASQALEGQGRIVLRTGDRGDQQWVEVEDNGRGIQKEHLARIFDPGFTTRGGRIGAGLGLAISYQIVQEHGGSIQVESRAGHGTKVQVHLPRFQSTSTQTS